MRPDSQSRQSRPFHHWLSSCAAPISSTDPPAGLTQGTRRFLRTPNEIRSCRSTGSWTCWGYTPGPQLPTSVPVRVGSACAARRVGSSGRLYAVDINRSYLDYIRDRARKEKLPNIRIILSKSDDPLLPPNSLDAVLLMKTYHEVAQPIVLLRHVRAAMRPGARLGIIDRNGHDDHGVNHDVVIGEVERAGFVLSADYDFVKPDGADYFLIFGPLLTATEQHAMFSNPKGGR